MIRKSVVTVDRKTCVNRPILIETVTGYVEQGAVVQIEDSTKSLAMRLCYEIQPGDHAYRLANIHGREVAVFADIAAMVDHAEAVTGN